MTDHPHLVHCYRPQRQGNVFTPVCHSVHREGGSASVHAEIPPPGQTPSSADTPQQTATTVDGTRVPTQPGKPGKMRVHLEISWNFEKFNKYHGKMT